MNHSHFNIPHVCQQVWRQYRCHRWNQTGGLRFLHSQSDMPRFVRECPLTMRTLEWLRLLDWQALPAPTQKQWFGREPISLATYIATFLVKLDQQIRTETRLHQFLCEHPALIWSLGYPLSMAATPHGFDPYKALPTHRHLSHVLRVLPNEMLQILLDTQVAHLKSLFPDSLGDTISLDTKHIVAWVKENNPKAYIKEGRYDKTKQPSGDPDCKLGCKRRHNRLVLTPTKEGVPAMALPVNVGEFYWGYASGVVVTKVPQVGEFVLAELTQTFDKGDTTYFFPLLAQTEKRLGRKPKFGTLDAAFDAFYVYDYFHNADHEGFAAVPLSTKGGQPDRHFDEAGLPLCAAGLGMPLKFTFTDRTSNLIPHERGHYVCPLVYPDPNGAVCPIAHKKWADGGCTTRIATSIGARIRHQLDRDGDQYKQIYKQRTAVERIFSQALELGIERPKLRNQQAITNQNTLIYLLINLRTLQRVSKQRSQTEG